MLKKVLFGIIRQEQLDLEGEIAKEQKRPTPDMTRICALRQEASSLRRELECYAEH